MAELTRIQTRFIEGKMYIPVRCEVLDEKSGKEHETINLIEVGVLIKQLKRWSKFIPDLPCATCRKV